ncbi:MAG: outer membrane lipoprotein carrier protein LolA [Verrucomicrobiota bacterium]
MFFVFLCLATFTHADATLEAWLERQSSIRSIEVAFQQTRVLPSLKNPVITTGKLTFARPDRIRWELGDPPVSIAVSDGKQLTLIDRRKRTARRLDVDSPQAAHFSLLARDGFRSPAAFRGNFRMIASRTVSGVKQYTLQPLDTKLRAQVPWVFIDIDPASLELRAFEVQLKDKSRIRSVFGKPRINGNLPDRAFEPPLDGITVR